MIRQMRNLVAFLTILPFGTNVNCLNDAADYMHLFPLAGALIGLLVGFFALILEFLLPNSVVGILTLSLILLLTGLHHTDGLLDFGDGLMHQGPSQEKIRIMHDPKIGTGGLALGLMTLLTTAASIGSMNTTYILQSLLVSETLAKFSMTFEAWRCRSAQLGMNTLFIEAMHGKSRHLRLAVALTISFSLSLLLLGLVGFFSFCSVLLTTFIIIRISNRHFKGVTGDVFGATNDLSRMVSLLTILVMIR